ncbi:unnamed protein product [Rotaria magnacalcarata]|uniref:Uncharacterized protein n=2 Tax=Rotaria magnacalcarata TaxID=392030 RepID=A0A816F9G2_9BILA|nr:unnamed protein product [Rotaria magnacalcarata]CAF2186152.1 unnamed protein product [Rotaria magnacalcarata]CAF3766680.1 unnamed protein product [Rotaria magnacalcarata]
MEHYESSLDKLDQLMQRYRRQDILRNQHYEDLSQRYYPFIKAFQLPLNHHCIYIHRLTSTEMLNNLINLASEIDYFTIDTQHHIEVYPCASDDVPAIIQIQLHSTNRTPLVLLIEVLYLQTKFTTRTRDESKEKKIKELFQQIFSPNKHIYAWGNPKEKLSSFYHYNLFTSNDLDQLYLHNVHDYFAQWYKIAYPHSLISQTRTRNEPYTLQTSLFLVFNEWLNTKVQYGSWKCGIDTSLKTYHRCFSPTPNKNYYQFLRKEIEYRQMLQMYAVNNCFGISRLMFHILQQWPLSLGKEVQISNVIHYKRKKNRQTEV